MTNPTTKLRDAEADLARASHSSTAAYWAAVNNYVRALDAVEAADGPADIRVAAWSFGRRCQGSASMAYAQLEAGDALAVRVFAALRRDEWGVKAALADGLAGADIVARSPRTGVEVRWTGGRPYGQPARRRPVAANGGTL